MQCSLHTVQSTTNFSSLVQSVVAQLSAVGISGAVALKAATLADLTGLLPAAVLATSGLVILPIQRYRLQRELTERIDDLSAALSRTLESHLEQELGDCIVRTNEIVAPFAALVERSQQTNAKINALLVARREEIDNILQEVRGYGSDESL